MLGKLSAGMIVGGRGNMGAGSVRLGLTRLSRFAGLRTAKPAGGHSLGTPSAGRAHPERSDPADLEIGDVEGLETCASRTVGIRIGAVADAAEKGVVAG